MKKGLLLISAVCWAVMSQATEGALKGRFTVDADGRQVVFAKGNLQYQAAPTPTWRFATNQWDMVGTDTIGNVYVDEVKCDNAFIADDYTGWIDLFGWGTGNNPTLSTLDNSDYPEFNDWGANAISNGGNKANLWRTLSRDEWMYLFHDRANAGNLLGQATVAGVHGLVLLPDNWTLPGSLTFTPTPNDWTTNDYDLDEWPQMEAAGAVFLPAAGWTDDGVYGVGTTGWYWSSTPFTSGTTNARYFYFYDGGVHLYNGERCCGHSVRLVQYQNYGLRICGKDVTTGNFNDLSSIEGVSGTITYNPGTKVLSLTDATLTTPDITQAIWNMAVPNLTIEVHGICDLNTPYCIALRIDSTTTIVGEDSEQDTLKVRNAGPFDKEVGGWPVGSGYAALATFARANLTIRECVLAVEGSTAIQLQGTTALTVDHAQVTAKILGHSSISAVWQTQRSFKANVEPILSNCHFIAPENVRYDDSLCGYTTDGVELTREEVVIDIDRPTTVIERVGDGSKGAVKRIENGQLVIEREGKVYDVQGLEIRD